MTKRKKQKGWSLAAYDGVPPWLIEMGALWSRPSPEFRHSDKAITMGGQTVHLPKRWKLWISLMRPWSIAHRRPE